MDCQLARQRLLGLAAPRREDGLRDHLAGCPDCRGWQAALTQIERALSRLPVPPAPAAKAEVVRQILHDPPPTVRPLKPVPVFWRNAGVAAAAAVILIALARLSGLAPVGDTASGPPAADPLLASVVRRHVQLAAAEDRPRRIEALADLAEDIDREARVLSRVALEQDLDGLANLYAKVVREGIVAQAEAMTKSERRDQLRAVANRLNRTYHTVQRLSTEVPPGSVEPLRRISQAADAGNKRLHELAKEAES